MTTQKPLLKNRQLGKLAQALRGKSKIPTTDMNEIAQFLFPLLEGPIEQKMNLIGFWGGSEKRQFRDALVSILDQKIEFSNRVEKLAMIQSSYVKIRSDSKYACQIKDIGIMQGDFGSRGTNERGAWAQVIFYTSRNYWNSYRECDLRQATINEILDLLSNKSFAEFKQVMLGLLQRTIEADCTMDVRNEHYRRFQDGEKIVMNIRANEKYGSSKEGSEGTVLEYKGNGIYAVKFTKLTGDLDAMVPQVFTVHESCMQWAVSRFMVGTKIIMNKYASGRYRRSRKGSIGTVVSHDGNGSYTVKFTELTDRDLTVPQTFSDIHERYMERVPLNLLASEIGGSEVFAQNLMNESTDMAFAKVLSLRMAEELVAKQILERLDNGFFKINHPMLEKLITEQTEEEQDSASDKGIQIYRDDGNVTSISYVGELVIAYSLLLNTFLTITGETRRESTAEEINKFKRGLAERIKIHDSETQFLEILLGMYPQLRIQQQLIL